MRPTTPSSPSSRVSRELMHVIDLMSEAEPSGIELRHFHTAWYSKRSGHRNAFKGNLAVAWFVANARRLNAFLPKAMAINGAPTAVRLGQHLVDAGHIEHLSGSVSGSSPRKNSDAGHYGGGGGGGAGGMFRNGSDKYRLVPRQGSLVEARVTAETVVELTRRMNRSEVAVHENSSSYASSSRVLRGLVEQQAAIQAEQRSAVTILLVVVCSLLLCMALKELQLYPKAFLARLSDEQAAAARGAGCASAALALAMYVILGRRGGSAELLKPGDVRIRKPRMGLLIVQAARVDCVEFRGVAGIGVAVNAAAHLPHPEAADGHGLPAQCVLVHIIPGVPVVVHVRVQHWHIDLLQPGPNVSVRADVAEVPHVLPRHPQQ